MPAFKFTQFFAARLRRLDPRWLLAISLLLGCLVWSLPLAWLPVLLALALLLLVTGWQLLPWFRKFIKAYLLFSGFWLICSLIFLRELLLVLGLGLRFACLPGLALPLLLTSSPIQLGRVCAWYCTGLCRIWLTLTKQGQANNPGWKAGLAVALTVSFLPRIFRDLTALQRNLSLRAPQLKALDKARLLSLGGLRLFGSQTWEQSLALRGRGLDQPEAWVFKR